MMEAGSVGDYNSNVYMECIPIIAAGMVTMVEAVLAAKEFEFWTTLVCQSSQSHYFPVERALASHLMRKLRYRDAE